MPASGVIVFNQGQVYKAAKFHHYKGGACFGLCGEWIKNIVKLNKLLSGPEMNNNNLLRRCLNAQHRYEAFFKNGHINQMPPARDFARMYGLRVRYESGLYTESAHIVNCCSGLSNQEALMIRINIAGGTHWVAIGKHANSLYFFCPNNGVYTGNKNDMKQLILLVARTLVSDAEDGTPIEVYEWDSA